MLEVLESPARFKVVNGGRRIRKTELVMTWLLTEILNWPPGSEAWYLGPTYRQVKMMAWRRINQLLDMNPWLRAGEANVNELTIPLIDNRLFVLKGCDNPDSIRGGSPCIFGFDEYAYVKDRFAWEEVIQPAISDKMGGGLFVSTPRGQENFWRVFQNGVKKEKGWVSFLVPTAEVGTVPAEELRRLKDSMPLDMYEQEYECRFLGHTGVAISEFIPRQYPEGNLLPTDLWPEIKKNCILLGAIDWAKSTGITAYLEAHVDQEGRIILTDELALPGGSTARLWNQVYHKRKPKPQFYIMGHDAWAKESEGYAVAEELIKRGMVIIPNYARKADAVNMLKTMCLSGAESGGRQKMPKFMVLSGRCPQFLSQIGTIQYDDLTRSGASMQGKRDFLDAAFMIAMKHMKSPQLKDISRETVDAQIRIRSWQREERYGSVSGLPEED